MGLAGFRYVRFPLPGFDVPPPPAAIPEPPPAMPPPVPTAAVMPRPAEVPAPAELPAATPAPPPAVPFPAGFRLLGEVAAALDGHRPASPSRRRGAFAALRPPQDP